MSESITGTEFLLGIEEYLRYIKQEKQAQSIHTLSRTFNTDNVVINTVKSFIQDLSSNINSTNLADLLYGSIKSDNPLKVMIHYLGTQINNQSLKDLIFAVIKNTDNDIVLKALAKYIDKTSVDKNVKDLIHGFTRAENTLLIYKTVLQYAGQVIENQSLAGLASSISRSIDSDSFENDFIKYYLAMLDRQYPSDKLFRGINNLIKSEIPRPIINDIFSRGQIRSKIWLLEELNKIEANYDNVLILAGWFGQIKSIYEKKCTYAKMRIVEIDRQACETSDYIFNLSNLENYKVKSIHADINDLKLHKNGYEWNVENFKDGIKYKEKFLPDLVINTSAEHMTEEWFHKIRFKGLESNPIIAIQSNNLFGIPEHINCVYSIDHMKKKFPMREILFEGELQLKGYKRVMIIGRL